jgi:hypothetical protein
MYTGCLSLQKHGSTFKQKTVIQNITFSPVRSPRHDKKSAGILWKMLPYAD